MSNIPNFKILCQPLTGSSFFFFNLIFMLVSLFLKSWAVHFFLFLTSIYIFTFLSPIYFLSPCFTLIFKQAFTLVCVTRATFHSLSSKVYSPSNLFEKFPFFLSPFFLLDLFLFEAECFCSNDAKYKKFFIFERILKLVIYF